MKSFTQKYKEIILPIIFNYVPQANVILYGSRARKDERAGSDIDIALDAGGIIEESKIAAILNDLEQSDLPISFDIVDFHAVSKNMQEEIIRDEANGTTKQKVITISNVLEKLREGITLFREYEHLKTTSSTEKNEAIYLGMRDPMWYYSASGTRKNYF